MLMYRASTSSRTCRSRVARINATVWLLTVVFNYPLRLTIVSDCLVQTPCEGQTDKQSCLGAARSVVGRSSLVVYHDSPVDPSFLRRRRYGSVTYRSSLHRGRHGLSSSSRVKSLSRDQSASHLLATPTIARLDMPPPPLQQPAQPPPFPRCSTLLLHSISAAITLFHSHPARFPPRQALIVATLSGFV